MKMRQFKARTVRGVRRGTAPRARLAVETLESRVVPSQMTNSLGIGVLKDLSFPPHSGGSGTTLAAGPTFQTINQPIAPYLGETSKLDITVPDFTVVPSLTDGSLTASFSPSGEARTVPGSWLSWSSPPNSESATPRVLFFNNATTETITLDSPVLTFGVEVEPNAFSPTFTVTATFMDGGGNVLGAIAQDTSGQGGARLFAATDLSGTGISSVVITIDSAAQGFAVAQVRYSFNNYGLAGPYVTGSTPATPVQTLDHVTVTFNQPTDPTTFTPDQVTLTDPNGSSVTITQDNIVPNADGTVYTISFDPQTILGNYTLVVGPNITDLSGNAMDQDFDGTPGKADDVYTATVTVTNELIVNGGFETGSFSGWSTSLGGSTFVSMSPNPPHSGSFAAQLGAVGSDDTFWQDLATTPGTMYHISFWYLSDGGQPADLNVSWDGTNIYSEVNSAAHPYVQHTFDLMATGSTTRLLFGARNDPTYNALDDVSVTPVGGSPGSPRGHGRTDATLASALVSPTTMRVSPVAVTPAAVTTDQLAANLDQYYAAPVTRQDPTVTSLRPVSVNPAHDPLDLSSGLDTLTL